MDVAIDHRAEAARLQRLADPAPGRVLYAIAALGVADLVAGGITGSAELAAATGADQDALDRVLRAAVELDVLAEPAPGRWELRPGGEPLRSDVPGSVRAELADNDLYAGWTEFLHTVRTGAPSYDRVFGAPMFERLTGEETERRGFHQHMSDRARLVYEPLLDLPCWPGRGVLVDLGGGTGGLLTLLLDRHPGLCGVLADLPDVLALSPLAGHPRVRLHEVDLFSTATLPDGDVHVLASVLHDWSDTDAAAILAACHAKVGELLVIDRVLPAAGPRPQLFSDLLMLAMVGGRERTAAQWHALAGRSGFRVAAVTGAADTDLSVLRLVPA